MAIYLCDYPLCEIISWLQNVTEVALNNIRHLNIHTHRFKKDFVRIASMGPSILVSTGDLTGLNRQKAEKSKRIVKQM